jgi:hypothetical protein
MALPHTVVQESEAAYQYRPDKYIYSARDKYFPYPF